MCIWRQAARSIEDWSRTSTHKRRPGLAPGLRLKVPPNRIGELPDYIRRLVATLHPQ